MRKLVILSLVAFVCLSGLALANPPSSNPSSEATAITNNLNDNINHSYNKNDICNSNKNYNDVDNRNTNINANNNSNRNESRSNSSSSSSSRQNQGQAQGQLQGQAQGQLGIVEQGNAQSTSYSSSYEEKHKMGEALAPAYPGINGEEGTNNFNGYSIFGGVGISSTAEYKVCIIKIATIKKMQDDGFLSEVEAKAEAQKAFKQFLLTTKDKRFLGFLWKTTGRNLLNAFGLLSWDSFWAD